MRMTGADAMRLAIRYTGDLEGLKFLAAHSGGKLKVYPVKQDGKVCVGINVNADEPGGGIIIVNGNEEWKDD